jgi:WD40-like Beta Propeller Repeat
MRSPAAHRPSINLRRVNRAIRALVEDQRRFAVRARRQAAEGQHGVYRTRVMRKYVSASTVVVSALMAATREAFPGQHEGDGWLAITVRVGSGRQVALNEMFARPTRAAGARDRLANADQADKGGSVSAALPEPVSGDPCELPSLRADAGRARRGLAGDRRLLPPRGHGALSRHPPVPEQPRGPPRRRRACPYGVRPTSKGGSWLAGESGRHVAFYRSGVPGIYVAPSKGGRGRLVIRNGLQPEWSPDGRYLAFVRDVGCGEAVCSQRAFVAPSSGGPARAYGPVIADMLLFSWTR